MYYFAGYFQATKSSDEQVSFAVPSGNFGNICAGHVARMMGLPIRQLVLATNENDVLDEFFRTGSYRVRAQRRDARDLEPVDGHLEGLELRALRVRPGRPRRGDRVRSLFVDGVGRGGAFTLTEAECARIGRFGFVSGSSTHADRIATIADTHGRFGTIIDTHTADGLKVAREHLEPGVPMIVLETALPAKFAATIVEAIGREPPRPPALRGIEDLPKRCEVMAADARSGQELHRRKCAE